MATYDDAYEFKKGMKALIEEVIENNETFKRCIKARKAVITTSPSDDTDNKVGVKFPQDDTEMFFPYNNRMTEEYLKVGSYVSVWYSYNLDNGVVMENGAWTLCGEGSSDSSSGDDTGGDSGSSGSGDSGDTETVDTERCLTFTGGSNFTAISLSSVSTVGINVQISDNASTWTDWDGSSHTVTNSTVYVRGYDNTTFSLDGTELNSCIFSGNFTSCTGNILSLLDYNDMENATMGSYAFCGLFYNCTSLTEAPELPATELASYCYTYMFQDCVSLVNAPSLPATTLTEGCYSGMFCGCTSLTTATELPATVLASYCYSYMFCDCTSLVTAPKLPATTLATYCYSCMFSGCTSLTTATELPATVLASYCYSYMFCDCVSLTTIPSLSSATSFTLRCCMAMFYNCTEVKVSTSSSYGSLLITTGSTSNCFTDMFTGTGGDFTGSPSTNTSYYTSNTTV